MVNQDHCTFRSALYLCKTVAGNGSQQSQCLGTDLSLTPLPYISTLPTSSLHCDVKWAVYDFATLSNSKLQNTFRKNTWICDVSFMRICSAVLYWWKPLSHLSGAPQETSWGPSPKILYLNSLWSIFKNVEIPFVPLFILFLRLYSLRFILELWV